MDLTDRVPPVVVGVDGSALADAAASAAVAVARRRLLPVRLVRAFDWPSSASPAAPPPAGREAARRAASSGLSRLRDALLPEYSGGRISTALVDGPAATVLVAESASATMLVLGAHGAGPLAEVLGPVRSAVIRRSASPVLSAAATARSDDGAPVVVVVGVVVGGGTDEEASTRHLLSAAMLEATTRSSDLVVVDLRPFAAGAPAADPELSVACHTLQSTSPGVRIRLEAPDDGSPHRFLRHGGAAQLLVVGRGRPTEPLTGPLRSLLAQAVVPVLVVPPVGDFRQHEPVRALSLTARP